MMLILPIHEYTECFFLFVDDTFNRLFISQISKDRSGALCANEKQDK